MANDNGQYWSRWLVGILWSVVFGLVLTIGSSVIANDKESRKRDDCLDDKLVVLCEKQQSVNEKVLVALARIETKLERIQ